MSATGAPSTADSNDGGVEYRIGSNLQTGFGFTRFVSLTLDLPVIVSQQAWDLSNLGNPAVTLTAGPSAGLQDLRIQPKVALLDREHFPLGLSVAIPISVPTGNAEGFLGEKNLVFAPMVITEFSDDSIRNREYGFRLAANLGYELRTADARIQDLHLGNALTYGLGLGIHPTEALEINAEFYGKSYGTQLTQNPAEVLLGLKVYVGRWFAMSFGGGTGILPGVGASDARVYGGFQFAPSFDPDTRDTDDDGLTDGSDRCPKDPEDIDGFQDDDGCPDNDNDADGREDKVDQCPNDPEDDDGYMDNDGCPDPDNDKDGVNDDMDRCPDQMETVNGYLDNDGCPDEKPVDDTDGDGYKDDVDRCPYDAEDMDGFEDEDGCPDKDNDGDSVPDASDKCPNEREVFNSFQDEDGCPDEAQRVVVEASRIVINDVIYFDTGKSTIQSRSFELLDEIASVILAHPEIKKIRIEGHTDSDGSDIANLRLSQARAEAVRDYLVSKGVDASRLDAAGFGESRPVADNTNAEGKAKNRRVEFIIVEKD
jgi:outer membrane protein OmpA-like peptidoglycan-associated protein